MAPSLLSPTSMPVIEGIRIPLTFYVVLKEPALLAGMSYPAMSTPWEKIGNAGFSGVVCLCDSEVSYDPYPLKVLFSAELEDLHYGNAPYDPETLEWLVRRAASIVKREMDAGKGIVVHCVGGIGRTGTVLGCVLRDLGFSADEVVNYLDRTNKSRGFRGWPETEWQAEMVRRY
ncbi:protein-tyrosine phosphatase family protein [Methanosarcina sp.]|uniref:protein-tyrosine phosphatase family protein n=1 Tax=Methanosarcina sp. TaxID=2213 RepID=UPI003C73B6D6